MVSHDEDNPASLAAAPRRGTGLMTHSIGHPRGRSGRGAWLGVEGVVATLLLLLAAGLLAASQFPAALVPGLDRMAEWLAPAAGGTGLAAGLAGLLGLWRHRSRNKFEKEDLGARLDALPAQVAVAVAAEHAAADNRLLRRVEVMGAGQTDQGYDAPLRLATLVQRLERVGEALVSLGELMPHRLEQVAGGLEARLGMSVPPLLDRLEQAALPIEAAGTALAGQAGTLEDALARALAEQEARLGGLSEDLAHILRDETAAFTAALGETAAAEAARWNQRVEEAAGVLQQEAATLAAAAWPAVEAQADILAARIHGAAEAAGAAVAALAETVPEAVIPVLHARMAEVLQGQLVDPLQARLATMLEDMRAPTEAMSGLAATLPDRCAAMAEAVAAPADVTLRLQAASLALEAAAHEATLALAAIHAPARDAACPAAA